MRLIWCVGVTMIRVRVTLAVRAKNMTARCLVQIFLELLIMLELSHSTVGVS